MLLFFLFYRFKLRFRCTSFTMLDHYFNRQRKRCRNHPVTHIPPTTATHCRSRRQQRAPSPPPPPGCNQQRLRGCRATSVHQEIGKHRV